MIDLHGWDDSGQLSIFTLLQRYCLMDTRLPEAPKLWVRVTKFLFNMEFSFAHVPTTSLLRRCSFWSSHNFPPPRTSAEAKGNLMFLKQMFLCLLFNSKFSSAFQFKNHIELFSTFFDESH